MKKYNHLFILSKGRVAAISKKDGSIVWEIKLKEYIEGSLTFNFGQISLEGDKLYIGSTGVLFCLNAKDGSLVWKNELKGWGYNFISMANAGNESSAAGSAMAEGAAVATMIATTA